MTHLYKSHSVSALTFVLLTAMLTGCAGPSTRVLPRETSSTQIHETPEDIPVLEEVNPFYLQEELDILTAKPRPSGSRGESEAARYMQQLLQDYGYTVERQRFRYDDGEKVTTGTNVVAARMAPSPDADILIVSTHHDTMAGSPGANDNASGVVTLLETARLLSRLPTDTELRFVSCSGTETNRLGARYYVESLSKRERERIIGAVDLNALGYVSDDRIVLGTLDGQATMLGDMLNEASWDVLEEPWRYEERTGGAVGAFTAGEIPVVSVSQKRDAFEQGTLLDTVETVDIERVSQVVDVLSRTVSRVMSQETPSMMAKAHFYNDLRDYAFVQKRSTPIVFGGSREVLEETAGIHGVRAVTNTDAEGRLIEKYQYRMKWFDVDQIILTNCYFIDGELDTISLEADAAGVDFEDMKERLTAVYGEPVGENNGPNGVEYDWTDPVYRRFFALIPITDGYDLEIREYSPDKTVLEQRKPDGTLLVQNIRDERCLKVMELLQDILPQEDQDKLGVITLFTDGVGADKSFLSPMESADGGSDSQTAPGGEQALWELGIDVDDALDENGEWRDETGTIRLLVRLYGQFLEASMPDKYRAQFEEIFNGARPESGGDADGTEESPENQESPVTPENPEEAENTAPETGAAKLDVAPGDVTEDDLTPPDFETAFEYFVLCQKPVNREGSWSGRVGFFYKFEELTAYRNRVRKNLQLHTGISEDDGMAQPSAAEPKPETQPQSQEVAYAGED